jgi:hypothetical protein
MDMPPDLTPSEREWFNSLPLTPDVGNLGHAAMSRHCPCGAYVGQEEIAQDEFYLNLIRKHYPHRTRKLGNITECEVVEKAEDCPLYTCHDCETSIYRAAGELGIALWLKKHGRHNYQDFSVKRAENDVVCKICHKPFHGQKFDVHRDCGATRNLEPCAAHGNDPCGKCAPLLSILFFVTDTIVFAQAESSTVNFGDNPENAAYWLRSLYSDGAVWRYAAFDQIKDDLEAFVKSLESKKPVPRIEKTDNCYILYTNPIVKPYTFEIPFEVEWNLTHLGGTFPVYERPQTYQAKWTRLHPHFYTETDVDRLVGSPDLNIAIQRKMGADIAFSHANSLQSESFSVWRFTVVAEGGEG